MSDKLNLSYQTSKLLADPVPVESASNMFSTLDNAIVTNRQTVNEHLQRLDVPVGPSETAQNYVNQYKYNLQDMVDKYTNSGNYAFMGRDLQGQVEGFLKDPNIKGLRESWARVDGENQNIRVNENIDANDRSTFIKDNVDFYEPNIDYQTGVYSPFETSVPIERKDVNTPMMQALNMLKNNEWVQGDVAAIDEAGNIIRIPSGAQLSKDDKTVKTANGTFQIYSGFDKMGLPFKYDAVQKQSVLDPSRTRDMVQGILNNDKAGMQYLVQRFVVDNLPMLRQGGGKNMQVGKIVQGIMDGTFTDELPQFNAQAIKNSIIDDTTRKLAESYAYANNQAYNQAEYINFGRDGGGGRGRSDANTQTSIYTNPMPAWSTDNPDNFKDLYTNYKNTIESTYKASDDMIATNRDPVDHNYRIPDGAGGTKAISDKDMEQYNNLLKRAMANNDVNSISEIGNILGWSDDMKQSLILKAEGLDQERQIFIQKRNEAKDAVYKNAVSDKDKALIDFRYGNPDIIKSLNNLGIDYNKEFSLIGGATDAENLKLLVSGLENVAANNVVSGIVDSMKRSNSPLSKFAGTLFNNIYGFLTNVMGYTPDSARGASDIITKLYQNGFNDDASKRNEVAKLQEFVSDAGRNINRLENQANEALATIAVSSKGGNAISTNYRNLIPAKDEPELINRLVSGLKNFNGKKMTNVMKLQYSNGEEIPMTTKSEIENYANIIKSMSEKNTKVVGIYPSPKGVLGVPYLVISIDSPAAKEGQDRQGVNYAVPLDANTGITSKAILDFMNTPDFRFASAEAMLTSSGVKSLDVDGTKMSANADGIVYYTTPDGKTVSSREQALKEYNIRKNAGLDARSNIAKQITSSIKFDPSGRLEQNYETARGVAWLKTNGYIDPNIIDGTELKNAVKVAIEIINNQ